MIIVIIIVNIDVIDIGISAFEGAASSGFSVMYKLLLGTASGASQAGLNYTLEDKFSTSSVEDIVLGAAGGLVTSSLPEIEFNSKPYSTKIESNNKVVNTARQEALLNGKEFTPKMADVARQSNREKPSIAREKNKSLWNSMANYVKVKYTSLVNKIYEEVKKN